jgi:glc operon protein GlcG
MSTGLKALSALVLCACVLSLRPQQASAQTAQPARNSSTAAAGNPMHGVPHAFASGAPPGPRPHPFPASPSMAAAQKIAQAAITACRGHHIGVTVLDAAGYPKLIYIPDGSYGFHAYMSFRKANTAVKFRMPSGKVAAAMKADPRLAAKYQAGAADFITFAGGLPLWSGKKLLGAVGVSGAGPSDIDEGCAAAAIAAAKSLLR